MRIARIAVATVCLFGLSVVWNGIVHLVILKKTNGLVQHLRRTDLPGALGLSLLLSATICLLFVLGYAYAARTGTFREGFSYGLFVGVFASLLVDMNQYLLYPLPFSVVWKWFVSGVLEFGLYGVVVSRAFPLRVLPSQSIRA